MGDHVRRKRMRATGKYLECADRVVVLMIVSFARRK